MPTPEKLGPIAVPFEVKGGSPFVYRMQLPGGEVYELVVTPVVSAIDHVPGMVNPTSPGIPVFRMHVQMTTATRKVMP
jgi:hypothetical protein